MLLDPRVEARKFDREVALLDRNVGRLQSLGAWRVRTVRPEIDVIFLPRIPFRVAVPTAPSPLTPLIIPGGAPTFQAFEYPGLAARAFGVRFDLTGYDQQAPSITFRDPWTWELAPYPALPIAQLVDDPKKPMIVLLDGHPAMKRPFLCLRGVREYHEHPQHDGDDWAMYRSSTNLYVLIERLARVALASVRPQLLVLPGRAGQLQLQLQWTHEVK